MAVQDLKPAAFPTLQWEAGQLAGPLGKLCTYATSQMEKDIDWYFRKR